VARRGTLAAYSCGGSRGWGKSLDRVPSSSRAGTDDSATIPVTDVDEQALMSATSEMPHIVVVAGPNGAGKSTAAPYLLRDTLEVTEFINADTIAAGLSAFRPESVAVAAGRIMLQRMHQLAADRMNFAFETTLASRSHAPWLTRLRADGYRVHLLFLWLRSPQLAIDRVAERVPLGGHDVPAVVVRRRYYKASGISFSCTCHWRTIGSWWIILIPMPRRLLPAQAASFDGLATRICGAALRKNIMSEQQNRSLDERFQDVALIERAVQRAVRAALLRHKQAGNSIAIWRDGGVVWIPPEDIPVEPER
jgi:predicted ABC-type ATPase